ncbi:MULTISPECIES: DUF1835 domain-containing protein [Metabacillus]|uniref:DUF1835 domain-containing protein n=2 Tax=Metabacillus TaxID=2675233 RepID=A0A179T7V1_9BACI|nr:MULTISPECIES: DUF1835 domain-containing protein [Metabacillus]OAS88473.1 hypothetical protein A6K24_15565 [Metabacillus litoralis]QNF30357.1 DUF1835 domain-containing protein [Metabacillus sp. KUDC1714]
MIHIVNGDVLGNKIKGLNGNIIVWREMYDFGPLNSNWSNDELINNRAIFFEEKLNIPSTLFLQNCNNQLNQLNKISREEEVVLWFEHDRYDQTMLMYILTQLSIQKIVNLSMVSVNSYPTISPFYGLGQLNFEQLTKLFNQRVKITSNQVKEAVTGWNAYTSSTLEEVKKWITDEQHELPFLLEMFKRQDRYFPSALTGLNEIELLALNTIAKKTCSFRDLYKSISPSLINDGLSDLHIASLLNELIKGENALLEIDGPLPAFEYYHLDPSLTISPNGENVLKGKANRIDLIGIDWWVGGVHLNKTVCY